MSTFASKMKRIHLNKVCRACLSERGRLKEIFSTRIAEMMRNCAPITVIEGDDLPSHVCVSCFHQIAKFFAFKKKMERSDRILRNYVKQNKHKSKPDYSDILDIAVTDADIEGLKDTVKSESEDDVPLSQRQVKKIRVKNLEKMQTETNLTLSNDSSKDSCGVTTQIFTDGPPPLIPLATVKSVIPPQSPRILPEDAPPLVPIKPLTEIKPETIVHILGDSLRIENEMKFKCSACDEEFSSVLAFKQHKQSNCQSSGLQCNICRKKFKERKRLIGHLKGHMVVKDHRCKICGKCYPNPSTFRVHMRTHTGERPFKCEVCNKGFARWAGVMGHMKTHNSNKPYKCPVCDRGFKILSNLERHKVLHTGNLPFCCTFCGKAFSQSDNLQLHVRTYHTYERPYLCNECGKGFVSSTRLNRHMWVHTGYKPYRCKQCPKAYSNCNDLRNHERTHSGENERVEKPHPCPMCEMRFFHPCRLAKHMKTHERAFACTECTKTFSSEVLLSKHVNGKHGPKFFDDIDLPVAVQEVFIQYKCNNLYEGE